MERLDKLLSLHNICSRRQAAALTRAGQVRLNGVAVRRADIHVDTARDTLEVNGKPLLLQLHLYIMMHKPAGVLSASRDPHGKTVVDLLPPELQHGYRPLLLESDGEVRRIVKAADKLSAHIKCMEELKAGNQEFESAARQTRQALEEMHLPELDYFMKYCLDSFALNLDQLE